MDKDDAYQYIRKWFDQHQERVDQIVFHVRLNRILTANGIDKVKLE